MKSKDDNGPYNIYAETDIIVEFYDLDPLQVVWHGNYIKYFEIGRRALMEKINYGYEEMIKSGYSFPVIEISVKYIGPLKFKDKARIKSILMEYENRILIRYEIRDTQTGRLTTKGFSTQMAYDMNNNDSCFVCPQILADKVEAIIKGETR